eukprot:s4012_g3.t1
MPIIPVSPVIRPVSGSSSAGKVKVEQEAASSVKLEAHAGLASIVKLETDMQIADPEDVPHPSAKAKREQKTAMSKKRQAQVIDAEQTRQAKQAKKAGDDAEIRPRMTRREYKDFLRLDQLKEQLERLQGIEERNRSLEAENRRLKSVLEALQKSFPCIQQGGAVDVAT